MSCDIDQCYACIEEKLDKADELLFCNLVGAVESYIEFTGMAIQDIQEILTDFFKEEKGTPAIPPVEG